MTPLQDETWLLRLNALDHAFQPVVNIHTGVCFGCEALLRNHEAAGFSSIEDVFNSAYKDNVLHQVDLILREKAIEKFSTFRYKNECKLFYNLDNRLINSKDYKTGNTSDILKKHNYTKDALCFEISEKHEINFNNNTTGLFQNYTSQGFNIAIDDCGTGFSGFQLLYYAEPDYIKIDRFFIKDIENDRKKRLFVSSIVKIAHFMGSLIVAEGVETRQEFFSCRDIGCDLVQGYFIQHPCQNMNYLRAKYDTVEILSKTDQRGKNPDDRLLVKSEMRHIEPVYIKDDIITIFEKFRTRKQNSFFP
ncbi:MAG: EAL domain-containing protein, partial [Desulfobacteraceae bacterium]